MAEWFRSLACLVDGPGLETHHAKVFRYYGWVFLFLIIIMAVFFLKNVTMEDKVTFYDSNEVQVISLID